MSQSSKKISPVYDVAIVSPLEKAEKISKVVGCDTYLKREDLQNVHSFKIRGAYNKIASLSEKQLQAGVITASAGNHAQGVALSAKKLKLKAIVVMPLTTPQIKIDAVKAYGAKVVLHGDSFSDCYEHSVSIARETGMTFVHPFDDEKVIEGQGTIAFEILEQLEGVTHVFIPVGGGGLLAGISQVLKEAKKSITVIGVEPQDANAMQASLKAIVSEYVDRVITVDNDEICAAIKLIFEDTRNICEPAGALAVAGAKNYFDKHPTKLEDSKVVCINSGSNITFERLQFVAERTLIGAKSESLFAITLPEKPGALKALYKKVIHGYSITEFSYRLTSRDRADIFIGLLTGDKEKKDVVLKLKKDYSIDFYHDFEYIDLSHDEYAKEHVRFIIGGKSNETQNERIYAFNFPERPGALKELLEAIHNKFNISLFHYRGQGGDVGSVLIGFEAQDADELEEALLETGYFHKLVKSKSISTFL